MSAISLEIKFRRENKVYYEGEMLTGTVIINSPAESKHEGIMITLEGIVNLQLSSKSVGLLDAFYNSVKPIQLLNAQVDLAPAGKLNPGKTEYPFELPLVCKREPRVLYETYHGIFINVNYQVRCDIKRSFLAKSLQKTQQFCIQYRSQSLERKSSTAHFNLSPESLQKNAKERISIPRFLITGTINQTECCVTKPLTGHLVVQHTEAAIKSIELQLVRIETCGCTEGYSKDATEIQTIQIADGNLYPSLELPIYMVFPRLFTCPTLLTKNFKIEFELNLIVIFKDDYVVSENFPLILKRTQPAAEFKPPNRGL